MNNIKFGTYIVKNLG